MILNDIIKYCQDLEPSNKNLLSEVGRIIALILVLPATNATSERSFSKLKLLKTYLRSTMSQAKELVLRHSKRENIFEIPK